MKQCLSQQKLSQQKLSQKRLSQKCQSMAIKVLVLSFLSLNANAFITPKENYYGAQTIAAVQAGQLSQTALLEKLFFITSSAHIKQNQTDDIIETTCESAGSTQRKPCFVHTALGYDPARKLMFGKIDLEKTAQGQYFVKDVYCEKNHTDEDFGGKPSIGPGLLPSSGNIINTEHTWPQSRFTGRFNKEMQKSDLHHLYPTDSQMNSYRSSLRFGEVDKDLENLKCPQNRLGHSTLDGSTVFQPPAQHRGNVARAIFYFAMRYKMKVSPAEVTVLQKWNKEDPVDAKEVQRNNMIEDVQGNRNPFVDYPEWIDLIDASAFFKQVQ